MRAFYYFETWKIVKNVYFYEENSQNDKNKIPSQIYGFIATGTWMQFLVRFEWNSAWMSIPAGFP